MGAAMIAVLLIFLLVLVTPAVAQDECVTGTNALLNNTAYVTAYEDMVATIQAELASNYNTFCTTEGGSIKCSVNVQAYSKEGVLKVCIDQGGQSISGDVKLTCSGAVQGFQVQSFAFDLFRVPVCIDASCDPNNVPTEIEAIFNNVADGVVSNIENALGDGVQCEASTQNPNSPTSSRATASSLLAAASSAAFLSFLLT